MTSALEQRLLDLERRVSRQEDMIAILQLIAAYGPAVDRLDGEAVAALWREDGSYDYGAGQLQGRAALHGVVDTPSHQAYVAQGCGHVLSLPQIRIEGDRAEAVNTSRVYLHSGDGWKVERCSANHWLFERTAEGWRVLSRQNRLLDGQPQARALLALS